MKLPSDGMVALLNIGAAGDRTVLSSPAEGAGGGGGGHAGTRARAARAEHEAGGHVMRALVTVRDQRGVGGCGNARLTIWSIATERAVRHQINKLISERKDIKEHKCEMQYTIEHKEQNTKSSGTKIATVPQCDMHAAKLLRA